MREGSNVTLKCRAHGSPTPTIKWKRDDNSKIKVNQSLSGEWKFNIYFFYVNLKVNFDLKFIFSLRMGW